MLRPTRFHLVYRRLLSDLLDPSIARRELNARTGVTVSVLPGAQAFQLDLSDGLLPTCGLRKTFPRTAAVELMWFLSGSRDERWLRDRGVRIWSKFVEDDGHTVKAAYGYRWRRHFGRDQLGDAMRALRDDPSDRRCYVSAWDPSEDGLGRPSKNVPCPVGFTLSVVDGRLHQTVLMRSSDVFVGLPYDVMGHSMLQAIVAGELGVALGTLTFTLAHPHLYSVHFEMAERACQEEAVLPSIELVGLNKYGSDTANAFINYYHHAAESVAWPRYNPRPLLVE